MTQPFWKLREFWTIALDLAVSGISYFGAKYLAPSAFEDIKWVIAALQPVAAFLVAYFAVERVQAHTEAQYTRMIKQLGK